MGLKKLRPMTPAQRFRLAPDFSEITTDTPEKSLLAPIKKSGGRNSKGRMTVRYRGGGHKRRYRIIDFTRHKHNMPAEVLSVEYDPNRTARISLVKYEDGEKAYVISPQGIQLGQTITAGEDATPDVGNSLPLGRIPVGSIVHNIELQPGRGAAMVRSAGTYAQILGRSGKYVSVKLPSGETRLVLSSCYATVGTVSNSDHMNEKLGKAGRKRWLGRRPRTRGVAMNPVDHPMGGGEGKSSGGHPRSRTGLYAKGKKTRSRKKNSNRLIISKKK